MHSAHPNVLTDSEYDITLTGLSRFLMRNPLFILLSTLFLTLPAKAVETTATTFDNAPCCKLQNTPVEPSERAEQITARPSDSDNNLIRAALKGWHLRLGAGFNVGGAAPFPMPREIRHINSYNPLLNIAIEGNVVKNFGNSPWGISVGVRLERKGMETDATVKNYHMEAVNADGSGRINGAWTGHVKTKLDNTYITFPIVGTYDISQRWQVSAGLFLAYRTSGSFTGEAHDGYIRDQNPTGEKAEVTRATYDFSSSLRRFHWGIQAGGQFKAYKHLAVKADLQWGVNGIFPADFESVTFALYPIYATFGFAYLF